MLRFLGFWELQPVVGSRRQPGCRFDTPQTQAQFSSSSSLSLKLSMTYFTSSRHVFISICTINGLTSIISPGKFALLFNLNSFYYGGQLKTHKSSDCDLFSQLGDEGSTEYEAVISLISLISAWLFTQYSNFCKVICYFCIYKSISKPGHFLIIIFRSPNFFEKIYTWAQLKSILTRNRHVLWCCKITLTSLRIITTWMTVNKIQLHPY